jgi:hypothetical protein
MLYILNQFYVPACSVQFRFISKEKPVGFIKALKAFQSFHIRILYVPIVNFDFPPIIFLFYVVLYLLPALHFHSLPA